MKSNGGQDRQAGLDFVSASIASSTPRGNPSRAGRPPSCSSRAPVTRCCPTRTRPCSPRRPTPTSSTSPRPPRSPSRTPSRCSSRQSRTRPPWRRRSGRLPVQTRRPGDLGLGGLPPGRARQCCVGARRKQFPERCRRPGTRSPISAAGTRSTTDLFDAEHRSTIAQRLQRRLTQRPSVLDKPRAWLAPVPPRTEREPLSRRSRRSGSPPDGGCRDLVGLGVATLWLSVIVLLPLAALVEQVLRRRPRPVPSGTRSPLRPGAVGTRCFFTHRSMSVPSSRSSTPPCRHVDRVGAGARQVPRQGR